MAEIYEIGEVVKRLQDTWPQESWGSFDENSIGIVSPYSDQVSRIRVHLRHRKLFGVNVERVLNVQGKFITINFFKELRKFAMLIMEKLYKLHSSLKCILINFAHQ